MSRTSRDSERLDRAVAVLERENLDLKAEVEVLKRALATLIFWIGRESATSPLDSTEVKQLLDILGQAEDA